MRPALPLLLALAALTAGCAESMGETVGQLRGDAGLPDPYYREYRQDLAGEHNRSYPAPVHGGAVALQVDLDLLPKAANGPVPPAASLTVTLLDPSGAAVASRIADARTPQVSLGMTQFPALGEYTVQVTGRGVGQELAGTQAGAYYDLRVEVVYA